MKHSIIFDMDGVLVNSEPVIESAAITGLAEYGVNARPEDFIPFVGAGEDKYIGGVAEKYGLPYRLEMKARVYEIYLNIVASKLQVYTGVTELLHRLKAEGHLLALASSADRIKVEANLRVAGIPQTVFSAIVTGEDVVNKKPSPDIFLKAAKMLKTEPRNCFVVEDALNGIRAAKAAGMKSIAIATTFSQEELQKENSDFVCSSTPDIYEVIKGV